MSTQSERVDAAKETLNIFKEGYYNFQDKVIKIHENSLRNTTLYTPESLEDLTLDDKEDFKTHYDLWDTPVVSALRMLKEEKEDNIGILNFASAKNPGGGFLSGALAQEESLAMCSNLYLTQIINERYYDENRRCSSMLYTDHMIYSKDVVFIREDVYELWEYPICADVLTAPAVNMGQYIRREGHDEEYGYKVMKDRMRKVLKVFSKEKNKTLILGAYGCGVFRNDPIKISKFFFELLKEEKLEKYFKRVVFAVYDKSKTKDVYGAFEKEMKRWINT